MKQEPQFATEADMCTAFIAWLALFPGWVAYPETCGWDILLAHSDGTQIGIQAKLRLNLKVLDQAVAGWHDWHEAGPDYRAILIPSGQSMPGLTDALGLGVFQSERWRERSVTHFTPTLERRGYQAWHFTNPTKRHKLPRYVPDVTAGASGPMSLTPWKIAALEIVATLSIRGYVTREDFKRAGIDHRRWTQVWLKPTGTAGQWKQRDDIPDFAAQHPIVYPQVLADVQGRLAGRQ